MKINYNKESEKLTVAPEGRIDTMSAPVFEKEVGELIEGVTDLVLDMTKVEYVSSAGLRVLLAAQKKMKGAVKLANVCELVMEVLEVTGLSSILTIE